MTDTERDAIAMLRDPSVHEPRPAPLDMPRQVLERPRQASLSDMFIRLFLRNA